MLEEVFNELKIYSKGKEMSANDTQHGGTHYKDSAIQPWDFIASNKLGYFEGNVVKYVARWRKKNGLEDLKKAQHYLQKLIEVEFGESDTATADAIKASLLVSGAIKRPPVLLPCREHYESAEAYQARIKPIIDEARINGEEVVG